MLKDCALPENILVPEERRPVSHAESAGLYVRSAGTFEERTDQPCDRVYVVQLAKSGVPCTVAVHAVVVAADHIDLPFLEDPQGRGGEARKASQTLAVFAG